MGGGGGGKLLLHPPPGLIPYGQSIVCIEVYMFAITCYNACLQWRGGGGGGGGGRLPVPPTPPSEVAGQL